MFCILLVTVVRDDTRIHPNIYIAEEGDSVEFNCDSVVVYGYTPTTWVFNNSRLFDLPYYQTRTPKIVLESVKPSDSGKYACFGLRSTGRKYQHFIAIAVLEVYSKFCIMFY